MIKKGTLLVMLFVFVMAIAGCGIAKGVAKSAIQGTKTVGKGPMCVAKKGWQAVKGVDNWMQKHLW